MFKLEKDTMTILWKKMDGWMIVNMKLKGKKTLEKPQDFTNTKTVLSLHLLPI